VPPRTTRTISAPARSRDRRAGRRITRPHLDLAVAARATALGERPVLGRGPGVVAAGAVAFGPWRRPRSRLRTRAQRTTQAPAPVERAPARGHRGGLIVGEAVGPALAIVGDGPVETGFVGEAVGPAPAIVGNGPVESG
jgi:hypothetical protein